MTSTLNERILALLRYSNMSAAKFALAIGCKTKQSIYEILNGRTKNLSPRMQSNILSYFPDINEYWLLTGEGPMLKQATQTQVVHGENIHGNTITQNNNNDAEVAVLKERVKNLESILSEKERLISEKERTIKLYEMMIENRQRKAAENTKSTGDGL